MDPWTVGLVVVLVIGVVAIAYGALADRRKNRRAAAEIMAPPDRPIPHFAPATPAPQYLSELQARRPPTGRGSSELSAAERAEIAAQLQEPASPSVPVGMLSSDFVTDRSTGWAVLDRPYVLVCVDAVATVREIIGALEKVLPTGRPLVVAAPSVASDVRGTLEVNVIQRTMALLAVEGKPEQLRRIADLSGADPVTRDELRSGYLPLERLGSCARWVSTRTTSHLLPAARGSVDADPDQL